MVDVRAGVDALDRQIVALIGERFRFMDAAARIKPRAGPFATNRARPRSSTTPAALRRNAASRSSWRESL